MSVEKDQSGQLEWQRRREERINSFGGAVTALVLATIDLGLRAKYVTRLAVSSRVLKPQQPLPEQASQPIDRTLRLGVTPRPLNWAILRLL